MNVERLAVHNLPLTYAGFVPLAGGSRSFWATQKLAFQQQDEFIIWETTCTKDALKTQSHLFNSLSLFYVITCKWLWRIHNFFGNYSNFDDYLLLNSVLQSSYFHTFIISQKAYRLDFAKPNFE